MKKPNKKQLMDLLRDLIHDKPEHWPPAEGWHLPENMHQPRLTNAQVRMVVRVALTRKWGSA